MILFVAHDGIHQPELWKKWLNEDTETKGKIGIAIQANNDDDISKGIDFVKKYRIDVKRRTKWGSLKVPLAIQRSLQLALERFPNAQRFYIISGFVEYTYTLYVFILIFFFLNRT